MQEVGEELCVHLDIVVDKLGVLGVQGERVRGGLAGFHGACQEVEGKDFHFVGIKWYVL
jgi:hypothetical protein